jgi:protein phosphatase
VSSFHVEVRWTWWAEGGGTGTGGGGGAHQDDGDNRGGGRWDRGGDGEGDNEKDGVDDNDNGRNSGEKSNSSRAGSRYSGSGGGGGGDGGGGGGIGEWRVIDLGSTNGTFLNGQPIGGGRGYNVGRWHTLRDGDTLRLGERPESPMLRVFMTLTSTAASTPGPGGAPPLRLLSSVRASPGKPPRMEDRALCECPLRGHSQVGLFAVFDGHAGAEAAERAKAVLPAVLARLLGGRTPGPGGAADVLRAAFLETDAAIACEYEGSTATAMLVWRCASTGRLYVQTANVGDSSCALGRSAGSGAARFLTTEHKVTSARERERLTREHGVTLNEVYPEP